MTDTLPPLREVLGVDVGGTKTHLAVGLGGTVMEEWVVSTTSWRTHSIERNATGLHGLVRDRLGDAALRWPLAVGAYGCDSTEQCDRFAAELRRYFQGPVRVVNDAELLVPATGRRDGIGLIAGTGSIAVARDPAGRLLTAGGWGWVLGDEGGAAGLVREAVRAVLGGLDRGEPVEPLGQRLFTAFDVTDGAALAMAVTAATVTSAARLGEPAVELFRAADEGSTLAARVIEHAGGQLADLVDRLLSRGVAADGVVAGGSVLLAQDRLKESFLAALRGRHPGLSVQALDRPPVFGALVLAGEMTPAWRTADDGDVT